MNIVDPIKINTLLANKQSADQRLKKALNHRSLVSDKINGKEDTGLFSERIVAVVQKGNATARLVEYAKEVKRANSELLEYAPQHFEATNNFFKEPLIIENVVRVHISTNKAISSHKISSETMVKRLNTFVSVKTKLLLTALDDNEKEQLKELIEQAKSEIAYFTRNKGDYRRRSAAHNDIVAMYNTYGGKTGPNSAQKVHATAGGLIFIRHSACKDENIIYSKKSSTNQSIYDVANGFECVLYPSSTMYSESEIELLRQARNK